MSSLRSALFASGSIVAGVVATNAACAVPEAGQERTSSASEDISGPVDAITYGAAPRADAPICDVRSFGARGDGRTKDTRAIQAAIDRCATQRGVVLLRDGVFLSGTIRLGSGIELRIEPSATLKGTNDNSDYPDLTPPSNNNQLSDARKALVYVESKDQVVIDGGGTIDGSGDYGGWTGSERTRPMAVFAATSKAVTIRDLTVNNAGMWAVVALETDNVLIHGLTVRSLAHPNRDGIDLVDTHHVLVEQSTIASDDDSICLKSGSSRGVFDVTVRDSRILQSTANGIKFGTASWGFFKKVLLENIDIADVKGAAMAVESVDGGTIDDVRFRGIRVQNVGTAFFVILGQRFLSPGGGVVRNVSFENIEGSVVGVGSAISGTGRARIENVTLSNVHLKNLAGVDYIPAEPAEYHGQYPDPGIWGVLPAYGYYVRHVTGFKYVDNSHEPVPNEARPVIVQRDVTP